MPIKINRREINSYMQYLYKFLSVYTMDTMDTTDTMELLSIKSRSMGLFD